MEDAWDHRLGNDAHAHVVDEGGDDRVEAFHSMSVDLVQREDVVVHCGVAWVLLSHVMREV